MAEYNSRDEVPDKYKWDLTDFFENENEFEETYKETKKLIQELENYVGCTKDINKLKEYLTKLIKTEALWEDLYVYSYLINDQELGISKNGERLEKIRVLLGELSKNTSFFAPEFLKLEKNEYERLIQEETLKDYKAYLERIYRDKEHTLCESEEKIVSELVTSMNNFANMSSTMLNSEHNYGKVKIDDKLVTIASNNYGKLLKNKDEKIRKKVYTLFHKKIDEYAATSALYLNGYVGMKSSLAKIYNYKNSWEEHLFSINVPNEVYKTLVDTTEDNLNVLQKYFKLKKDILGLDVMHTYDLNLDMENDTKKYTIEEAQDLVRVALKPLGSEYAKRLNKVFDNHYIDYCQYKGKCSGGYNFSTTNHDSRILMSFNDNLDSVSTIIHEAGHNVHQQFLKENNKEQYRDQVTIVSEVCSLTNECLLSEYLYQNGKTIEEKKSGLSNIIDVISSNLYGATREGKLEQDMYSYVEKGNSLSKDYLNKIVKKSLKKYYGDTVKLSKYDSLSWVRRSHYFNHFYLYSYAICVSIATYIASEILKGNKKLLDNYLKFMTIGSDKWPMETFEVLGINLTDKNIYEYAINYYNSLIDRYQELCKGGK